MQFSGVSVAFPCTFRTELNTAFDMVILKLFIGILVGQLFFKSKQGGALHYIAVNL